MKLRRSALAAAVLVLVSAGVYTVSAAPVVAAVSLPAARPLPAPLIPDTIDPEPSASGHPSQREPSRAALQIVPTPVRKTVPARVPVPVPLPLPTPVRKPAPSIAAPAPATVPPRTALTVLPVPVTACKITNIGADVAPNARRVACFLDRRFPAILSILGRGGRATAGSDHPIGRAADLIVGTQKSVGDQVAACAAKHFNEWNLSYIIWNQRIQLKQGGPFTLMANRGSITANHKDHVHLSFRSGSALAPAASLSC